MHVKEMDRHGRILSSGRSWCGSRERESYTWMCDFAIPDYGVGLSLMQLPAEHRFEMKFSLVSVKRSLASCAGHP